MAVAAVIMAAAVTAEVHLVAVVRAEVVVQADGN